MDLFAETINDFHLNLFRQITGKEKNSVYSPISTLIALGMAYTGTNGKTMKIMKQIIFSDKLDDEVIKEEMANLISFINTPHIRSYEMLTANRMYCEKNFNVLKKFKDDISNLYSSEIVPVDFVSKSNLVRKQANSWVSKTTKNRIKDIIPVNSLNQNTRIILINAIYFKGFWANSFDRARNERKSFHVNEETKINVDMMKERNKNFLYYENEQVQVLAIPYRGQQLCMYFFLPQEKFGLDKFLSDLNGRTLVTLIKAVRKCEVAVNRNLHIF